MKPNSFRLLAVIVGAGIAAGGSFLFSKFYNQIQVLNKASEATEAVTETLEQVKTLPDIGGATGSFTPEVPTAPTPAKLLP